MSDPPDEGKPQRPKDVVPPALSDALKQIQQSAAEFLSAKARIAPFQADLDRFTEVGRVLNAGLPRMDDVIASSTATGMDLRGLASDFRSIPLKSGTEYGLERVEGAVTRLAEILAGMADNTAANAEIAKTGLEQSIALVDGLRDLHETTNRGIDATDRSARALIWLTRALALLTIELVVLTLVLVMRANP